MRKRQDRIAKLRLAHLAPSGVKWTQGKGVIGRCWATGDKECVNLHTHFASFRNANAVLWDEPAPTIERYGLSFRGV